LGGTLDLAGSADDTRIIVNDHGLLSFVALYFLKFEHRNGAYIDTDGVAVAFAQIDCDFHHDLTPLKVEPVLSCEVISSWLPPKSHRRV